jgi:cob(I)alamin adenosyltransferase
MKITTKTGDKGETSLFSGRRVSKGDALIDLLGEMDELQCFIGWCGVVADNENRGDICLILERVQDDLFKMMAFLGNDMKWSKGNAEFLEEKICEFEKKIEKFGKGAEGFSRPGSSEINSRFHIARCVCRRVERKIVKFKDCAKAADLSVLPVFIKYLNRLSDLLFALAVSF